MFVNSVLLLGWPSGKVVILVSSYYFFAMYNPDKIRNKEILTVVERAFNNEKENLSPPFPTEWQKLF